MPPDQRGRVLQALIRLVLHNLPAPTTEGEVTHEQPS
jgi:hypothetical protein